MDSRKRIFGRFTSLLVAMLILITACASPVVLQQPTNTPVPVVVVVSDADATATSAAATAAAAPDSACDSLTPIKLQLQWVVQSQFAGYFAAVDKGFYEAECLDVTILQGAVDIVPQQVLASGQADFAIAWVPKALVSRA